MTTADLLADLRSRGIALYLDGERLRFQAPRGAYTDELRAAVAAHRDRVIATLLADESTDSSRPAPAVAEFKLWALVDRLDCDGTSLGRQPTCLQELASYREDRSAWAQLGDGSWWRAANLRCVSGDGRKDER